MAGPLGASDDWLGLAVPSPLARVLEVSLAVHQAQRETWARAADYAWMTDTDGIIKQQRLIEGELGLRWQKTRHWSLGLAAPMVFAEMAPFAPPGSVINFAPGDASLRRTQGLGDLRAGLRYQPGGSDGAWSQAWLLEGVAPTGLGPFEAGHPLAAIGEGRWAATLGWLLAVRAGAWHAHLDLRGRYQFGRESRVPERALIYDSAAEAPRQGLPPGPAWLEPRMDLRAALGLGWDWFASQDQRQSLALALIGRQQQPWKSAQGTAGSGSLSLALQPELQARYGSFNALAGWQSPFLYAVDVPAPDWGELHVRLDYEL